MKKNIILVIIVLLLFVGCQKKVVDDSYNKEGNNSAIDIVVEPENQIENNGDKEMLKGEYQLISQEKAYEMMINDQVVILDVRTVEEYNEGHIKNSVLVPLDTLESELEKLYSDKETVFLVYCRSGNRSRQASELMISMGYEYVLDFGGINTWTYDIEKILD